MPNTTEETPMNPITDTQLYEIAGRAAGLYEYATGLDDAWQDEADQLTGTDVPALLAEVRRLRDKAREYGELAARRESELIFLRGRMEQIRHLHKDSPMGPCPVCIDADAAAAGGDGLVPYPCPTGRLAGAQDCDPPSLRAAAEETREIVHGCPPDGSGLTPCCGRTPFELPLSDRISSEAPVTCPGTAPVSA